MNRRQFLSVAATGGATVAGGPALGRPAQTKAAAGEMTAPAPGSAPVAPPNRRLIRLGCTRDDPVLRFAVEELARCLRAMSGASVVPLPPRPYAPAAETLWVGCLGDHADWPVRRVADLRRDDAILIEVDARRGFIVGANPRAALMAVYRYLTELGCRWVRPGRENEQFPSERDPLARTIRVAETPAARHRGVSIEGACSNEHVTELVDWLPKVGMNTGMIEYTNAFIYYNNWYSRRQDPAMSGRLMSDETATELADHAVAEMKRRGLLVHRMGHGWTCFVLDIPSELWDEPIQRDFGERTRFMAQFEGRRQLYRGIPRRTHLCYSQPEVRTRLAQEVVKYAAAHPEVDYVHFWLADGANHCCECDNCRRARPADWYVMTLNEIDRQLAARGLPTRIAFLAYADLLWPPERERFANPDRFLLMFATLARSYFEPFHPEGRNEPVPPFELNRLKLPRSQNLNFLAGWQRVFAGDSFIYDYRYMWVHYDDPGYMALARAAALDMPSLAAVGLNGLISNQTERAFLPTALPLVVMAQTLWRHERTYREIEDEYFTAAFGAEGGACRDYLDELSRLFNPPWLEAFLPGKAAPPPGSAQRLEPGGVVPPGTAENLARVARVVAAFRPAIARNRRLANPVQARSWAYLELHAEICAQTARALGAEVRGQPAEATALWQQLEREVNAREGECHPVFDVFLFLVSLRKKRRFNSLPAHLLVD